MSAFTGGIKRPQVQSQNNNSGQQQSQYDRLVTVLGYNTQAKTMVVEDDKGKKYEVFVNPDEYSRGEKAAAAMAVDRNTTWMGHSIDKQMEKNYPAGAKVIIKASRVQKKDNGQGMAVTEVQRVVGVPNPEPDKTYQGVFTATSRTDENRLQRISRIQHWFNLNEPANPKPRAIDVNNEEDLMKLKDMMDSMAASGQEKIGTFNVTMPTVGVQFRALIKTGKKSEVDGTEVHQVVDTSIPFDWMPGPEDENGKEIKSQAHPISGDEMLGFVEQYIEYVENNPEFKDFIDQGNMVVEVCPYKSFPASNNKQLQLTFGEPNRDQHADKNPLYQLSHRKSFVDIAQSEAGQIQGRNYAVSGIIQISPNKLEKVNGKPVEISSYWVNNLHANGTKGHVHAFIRTSDDCKAELHEHLKLIYEPRKDAPVNDGASSTPARQAPAASPAPAPARQAAAPAAAPARHVPQDPVDLDDDFNPFAAPEASEPAAPARTNRFGKK